MRHQASPGFWAAYHVLPAEVRRAADSTFEMLKQDPHHPSLRFRKVGHRWSARIGLHYRALAYENAVGFVWVWIGPHAEYDKIIRLGS